MHEHNEFYIEILSDHLCLGLAKDLFPVGSPVQIL
jgi:hypothetical protein